MEDEKNASEFDSTIYLTTKKVEDELSAKETFKQKCMKLKNYITVEPFMLFYFFPIIISGAAVQKLNLEKACRVNLGITEELCTALANGQAWNITEPSVLVAQMTAWQTPLSTALPAIMMLPLGAWSDRSGNRKSLMLIAIVGQFISALGLILTTYFFLEWPLFVTALIEALPPAMTGGLSIALMAAYSFMADITTKEDRTFRIGIVTIIVTLSIPIGTSISGILVESMGYFGIFILTSALYALGFFYVLWWIHDVKRDNVTAKDKSLLGIFNLKYVKGVWEVFTKKRQGSLRLRIFLLVIVHIVIVGPIFAEGAILYLYVLGRFGFTIVDFTLFSTFTTIIGLIGTSVAIALFSKRLKMDDTQLGLIATICKISSSLVYAFAPTWEWFYAAPVVDIFGNSGSLAIRSLGTKLVDPDEVGKMTSIIGLAEALAPVVYTPLYSNLYASTITTLPGAYFLLGGAMIVPALFIFYFMCLEWMKEEQEKHESRDIPETDQYTCIEISHL